VAIKKVKLSDKKKAWVGTRNVVLNGVSLAYNAGLESWYKRKLTAEVNKMTKEVKSKIIELFRRLYSPVYTQDESLGSQARILMNELSEAFEKMFNGSSLSLSKEMVDKTLKQSELNLAESLKKLTGGMTIKTGFFPEELADIVTASISENVSLIKSIPTKYLTDVTGSVMRSVTSGKGLKDLIPEINKYDGMTKRRAELLALDQTRKAYSSINAIRLDKLGVKKFKWLHSGGGQYPRPSHVKISGHVFSFANLEEEQAALGVPKEDRGLPAYPINCKCQMIPVIEFD
jgi:SPP1 gp7 family putative phage head morphogenesis protein